jgi:hypothetical protein
MRVERRRATGLGFRTVRTITGKADGTDRTSEQAAAAGVEPRQDGDVALPHAIRDLSQLACAASNARRSAPRRLLRNEK